MLLFQLVALSYYSLIFRIKAKSSKTSAVDCQKLNLKIGVQENGAKMSETRPNRARLAEYYKISDAVEIKGEDKSSSVSPVNLTAAEKPESSPFDINSSSFDPELYSQKLIKEASLSQIMAQEGKKFQIHVQETHLTF